MESVLFSPSVDVNGKIVHQVEMCTRRRPFFLALHYRKSKMEAYNMEENSRFGRKQEVLMSYFKKKKEVIMASESYTLT